MFYVVGLITAGLIVAAQALWKSAVDKYGLELKGAFWASADFWRLFLSFEMIGGMILYVIATLFYLWLLNKYQYSSAQALVVSSSLVLTMCAAAFIFHERLDWLSLVGVGFLIVGVLLVTRPTV